MKRTIAVLLILAGLGAYVYFIEIKGTEVKERVEKRSKKLVSLPENNISQVRITNAFGEILLRKSGEHWRLAAPVSDAADDSAVNALLSTLISADTKSTVEGAADAAVFGLQPPKITIEIEGDGTSEVIKVGKRSPVSQDLYVQRGNEPVIYQATGGLDGSASKNFDEFRAKQVFAFSADAVTAVTLKNAGSALELRRNGADWTMKAGGMQQDADDGIANGLAQDLANLRLTKWKSEHATPAELDATGLKSPLTSIEVELTDGAKHALQLGKMAGNDQSAKVAGRPQIIELASWSTKQLLKTPEELRDRQLMAFAPNRVDRLVMRTGASEIVIRRAADGWDVSGSVSGKANADRISEILTALTELRANEFKPSTPQTRSAHMLTPPLRTLEAYDVAGKQLGILNFGKDEEDWAMWAQSADKRVEAKIPNDFVKNKWPNDSESLFKAPKNPAPEGAEEGLAEPHGQP